MVFAVVIACIDSNPTLGSIIYASCLEGLDPVQLFEKQMNERREVGYDFNKEKLLEYNHTSFGGPPVIVETDEEADELLRNIQLESAIDLVLTDNQVKSYALAEIEICLQGHEMSLEEYPEMPESDRALAPQMHKRLIHE